MHISVKSARLADWALLYAGAATQVMLIISTIYHLLIFILKIRLPHYREI